jgi:hypothetical protein
MKALLLLGFLVWGLSVSPSPLWAVENSFTPATVEFYSDGCDRHPAARE